jgi:hypothetical protein
MLSGTGESCFTSQNGNFLTGRTGSRTHPVARVCLTTHQALGGQKGHSFALISAPVDLMVAFVVTTEMRTLRHRRVSVPRDLTGILAFREEDMLYSGRPLLQASECQSAVSEDK